MLKYLEYTSFTTNNKTVDKKHYDIALDLKVSREAISRILGKLEKKETVTLWRNKITLN